MGQKEGAVRQEAAQCRSAAEPAKQNESTLDFVDNRSISTAQRILLDRKNNATPNFPYSSLNMPAQRREDKEPLQGNFQADTSVAQLQEQTAPAANKTGMPDKLKSGIESLSGMDMSDVRVHRNSSKPAQLNAHAYAQGNNIHLGPGQEQHLPHEAWHVVQQRQGRVKPTMQMKGGVPVNDDASLEKEADIMGSKAQERWKDGSFNPIQKKPMSDVIQAKPYEVVEGNPRRGKVEVTAGADKVSVKGNVTDKTSGDSEAVDGSVLLHKYTMPHDRALQPIPALDTEVPDALRVHNLSASPRGMRLGQLLTYHHGLEAVGSNIPYVIAMNVTAARGPFYTPLGFTDYNASQPYQTLKGEAEAITAFIHKGGPFAYDGHQQELIERLVAVRELMAESSMIIRASDLVANSKAKWQQVWSVDRVEEDSRKARSMENAYSY